MKITKYKCNLCGDTGENPAWYLGVSFTNNKGTRMKLVNGAEAENHLCGNCVQALASVNGELLHLAKGYEAATVIEAEKARAKP